MPLEPLKQFYCDHCGAVIESVKDAWLEWIDNGREPQHGFRIVHAGRNCYYPESADISDNHLIYFTGVDGLDYLLSLMGKKRQNPADPSELIEIIRRIHLPYYEEARRYIQQAINDGFTDDEGNWHQNELKRIIGEYGQVES